MRRSSQHSGFTLVEVLVSVAIALLLIVGVNTVFKVTAQTVGAGESLLAATRDGRTILQTVLADVTYVDPVAQAGSVVGNGPFFVIRSEHVYAYRNAVDYQSATNTTDPSQDTVIFSNTVVFPGNRAPIPYVNFRSHRIDRLAFVSRGLFARQTSSNNTQYVSTTTGNEALIVYEHGQQPNNATVNSGVTTSNPGVWFNPGDPLTTGKNDNNFYACDWMLSRMATVLIPTIASSSPDSNYLVDNGDLSPLTDTSSSLSTVTPIYSSASSRLDLANTSIAKYTAPASVRPSGIMSYAWGATPGGNYGKDWWDSIAGGPRYQVSPFILSGTTVPKITPATLATCAPDLIRGCSQFIVEYAGNFYTKTSDGTGNAMDTTIPNPNPALPPIHCPVPDPTGQLDFYLDTNGHQHTRWYGYPRAVNGLSGTVSATSGDVVPLRDVFNTLSPAGASPSWGAMNPTYPNVGLYADAERFSQVSGTSNSAFPPAGSNYWTAMTNYSGEQSASTRYAYTAAWGPDVHYMAFPKMIRIIVEVDDHEGRLHQPQRYEFIYDVQN